MSTTKKYYGDVKVSGEIFSVGFVFRVVNKSGMYHKKDDTMVFPYKKSDTVNGIFGLDIEAFHNKLLKLYCYALYEINI